MEFFNKNRTSIIVVGILLVLCLCTVCITATLLIINNPDGQYHGVKSVTPTTNSKDYTGTEEDALKTDQLINENDVTWTYQYANALNLDLEKFKQDLFAKKVQQRVLDDLVLAQKYSITQTPTVLIDGEKQTGIFSFKTPIKAGINERFDQTHKKVQVEIFTDLQCPACKTAHTQIQQLIAEEPSILNKADFYFRHYPIYQIHAYSLPAAIASEAAREQGKFDEFVSLILDNQTNLANPQFTNE